MSARPSTIHSGCGYSSLLHDAIVPEGAPIRFSDGKHPGGIPLLQYADDTTFFIQGLETAARTLSMMMDVFTDISGLQLNRAKSTVVGFNLSAEELSRCAETLVSPIGTLPLRYLGLPLMEKVESRLGGWRGRLLSRGGRLILVKTVLSALLTYFMSVFQMPAGLRRQLEGIMRRFFGAGQIWCEGAP